MEQRWFAGSLRISVLGLVLGGLEILISSCYPGYGQLVEDATLGVEGSQVIPFSASDFAIAGGARRGANLFHSFGEFNVSGSGSVFFVNPAGVENILTRVTGQNRSRIDGTLGVAGTANLFLINPNGITFGANARLQVGGSFVATTANAMQFGDRGFFSASAPTPPSLLLTVNPSAFVFNQLNQGAIVNQSRSPLGATTGGFDLYGLRVPPGRSIALVGGNVRLEGGGLRADGGRVELGGLIAPGQINLTLQPDGLALQFPAAGDRADVSLSNSALVSVAGTGGGSVAIHARQINLTDGSLIRGGIETAATAQRPVGDIVLNATSAIQLDGLNTEINNNVRPGSIGDAGNIALNTNSFSLTNGAVLRSVIFGAGNSGNIAIVASGSVQLDNSILSTGTAPGGRGNGGLIQIKADSFSLINESLIDANTLGQGNGGTVLIQATGAVNLIGSASGYSTIRTGVAPNGQGRAGDLVITADSLSLRNGLLDSSVVGVSNRNANTPGRGQAGNIVLSIRGPVSIEGLGNTFSVVDSGLGFSAEGRAGQISLTAGSLFVRQGFIASNAFGRGDAGDISIQVADEIQLSNTQVTNSVLTPNSQAIAVGNGGQLRIQTRRLTATEQSSLVSQIDGQGNAGNLFITVDMLQLNNSTVGASPRFLGRAGTVQIDARDAVVLESGANIQSALLSGVGQGGNITINTGQLLLDNALGIGSFTNGQGRAGDITLNVRDRFTVNNSFILSLVAPEGQGRGGDIRVRAGSLLLQNGGIIDAATYGQGDAGNITIDAENGVALTGNRPSTIAVVSGSVGATGNITLTTPRLQIEDKSSITANSFSVDGGNITLNLDELLLLRWGGIVSTNAGVAQQGGNGGNITISIPNGFIVGVQPENSDITANAFKGSGGRVNITAQGIFGLEFRPQLTELSDITASSTLGVSGVVTLNLPSLDLNRGLVQLPQRVIDTDRLLASSCFVRDRATGGVFLITGTGGLPVRPGDLSLPTFPTGEVQGVEQAEGRPPNPHGGRGERAEVESKIQNPKPKTEPIVEAQGIYRFPDGQIVLSRECDR